jgi:two-component system cell cycle response regulator
MPAKLLSKKQVVVRIGIIICLAEFLIMQLLASISYEAERSLEALIDAVLLTALSTPPIYVWVVKPFVNARDEALAQISHLAFTDPLTQLANRRLLTEHLEKIIAGSIRHGMYGAVLLVDLDGFKHINDTHGHDAGDAVLIEVGNRLQTGVRAEDTIGRLGGDEFVVLASNLDSNPQLAHNKVARIAESLIGLLSEPCVFRGEPLHIGASIGVRLLGPEELDAKAAISDADTALYRAKRAGKGCAAFFE